MEKVRIAIACDERAQTAKEQLVAKLAARGYEVQDAAPSVQNGERPDYAEQVALTVLRHDADRGIILTERAVGASIAANRVPGICAAVCQDAFSAHIGAQEEGMNVLVLALHMLQQQQMESIVNAYLEATLAPIDVIGGLPPRRLQRVLSHINDNISRELSVAELAQVVGMSQYYFSKLFKMNTETTQQQYVMRQRVERAQEHLRSTRTPLAEIATAVGFETQSHFTSVFRRLAGVTPKHYRDMYQSGQRSAELQQTEAGKQKSATAA